MDRLPKSYPSPFIQLVLLFGNGVFGTSPDFPGLWGSEIKPFSITHVSQEIGKGSEDLEAVVVFLPSSWSWIWWGCQAGTWHCHVRPCPCSLHLVPPFWGQAEAEHKAALSPGPSCPQMAAEGCQPHY